MQKILISLIISITLSFLLGTFIEKNSQEKWYLSIAYEHLGRGLDLNYQLLDSEIASRTEKNFNIFVTKITKEIITKSKMNPCAVVRGVQDNPNIIIKNQNLYLEISMFADDRELILKCEKYIDKSVNSLEQYTKKLIGKILAEKNYYGNLKFRTKELQEIMQKFLKREFDSMNSDTSYLFSLDSQERLQYIGLILNVITQIENNNKFINLDLEKFNFVKKIKRDLNEKKQNTVMLYLGLFIIFQFLFTMLLFRKYFFKNQKFKKKFAKIFTI